jgi:predicted permease
MDSLVRDLRFAIRGLLRTPGFTAAAVLALALGIGATTALFSVVHAVLMRSLGWGEESRLVAVRGNFEIQNLFGIPVSAPEYEDLRRASFFQSVGVSLDYTAALQGERAERVPAGYATGSFFEALGVPPAYGRVFTEAADHKGGEGEVLLAWSAFRKRFGADPAVVGKTVTLNGKPRTVVGVLPESFRWTAPNEFWLPFGWSQDEVQNQRGSRSYNPVARLRPGLTVEASRSALAMYSSEIAAAHLESYARGGVVYWKLSLEPLRDRFVGPSRQPLLVLFGAVLLVLLIACANVANLLLARGAARSRELAVRSALGAGRWRLVQQLLTESALLAVVGAAAGIGVATCSLDALLAAAPAAVRQLADVHVSRAVLGFAALLTVATTLVFGLAPALSASRTNLAESLKDGSHGTSGPRAGRLRSALIVGQVALSLMLLIGAGLLLRSFSNLIRINAGFDPRGVLAAKISLSGSAYDDDASQARFWAEAVRRASALPGVEWAGAVNLPPLEGHTDWSYVIEGRDEPLVSPDDEFRRATGGYFGALRIPIQRGRAFTTADDAKAHQVLLVNEAWVRRFFPGQDVIGKVVRMGDKKGKPRSIVGVVADVRDMGLDKPPVPVLWAPEAQMPDSEMVLMVRTAGPPSAVAARLRQQLSSIDPAQPIDWIQPFEERVDSALAPRRFPLQLLGAFAALALVLSAVGIYGVTAYGVAQRTRELGVRIAIGAQAADVLRTVMGSALRLAGLGVAIGLAAALSIAQLLSSLLYGVSARDPLTYAAISLLLTMVALLASFLPAHRATRVDPMTALRAE